MISDPNDPSPNLIDLFGMKVQISDVYPADLMTFTPSFQPKDVAEWVQSTKFVDCSSVGAHDLIEAGSIFDDIRETKLREFERQFYGVPVSTTETWNSATIPPNNLTFEALAEMMRRAADEMKQRDRKLIESFLDSGFQVSVNEMSHKPIVVLPKEYKDTYHEIMSERLRKEHGGAE